MKRWTTSAFALLLVLFLAVPATSAEDHGSNPSFDLSLDLHAITNWLITLLFENTPVEPSQRAADEQPQAFIEGLGPYIIPVGLTAPDTSALEEMSGGEEAADTEDQ